MNESPKEQYFLQPGYIFVSPVQTLVSTVLGSCVAVCLWDEVHHIGGINHFVNPVSPQGKHTARYGDAAVPHLIRLMIQAGATKANLRAHVIGGAVSPDFDSQVGYENVLMAEKVLKKHDIHVNTRDVGGTMGKKIVFDTGTGEVLVYKCMKVRESDWYRED